MTDRPSRQLSLTSSNDEQALCRRAREVGDELRGKLLAARSETNNWSDREEAATIVSRVLQNGLDQLAATDCWGPNNRLASGELWQAAGELLEAGWLQHHARVKPRGYAGDFEMLQKICDGWLCDDPLGQAFDRFFQNQAAPEAVRNRARIVAERIASAVRASSGNVFHAVSVGAGPGIDIELAAQKLTDRERQRLHVTLLDLDAGALEHAEARLSRLLAPDRLSVHRENLFRLPRLVRAQERLREANLISCPGLFDYLGDRDAAAMLSCFWEHLTTGGEAIVFNFTPANRSRAYMEWIGNWYLIYRTTDAFTRIVRDSSVEMANVEMDVEPSGASFFISFLR